ncbi:MAG: DUF188 domain-containing protein [Spirochaetaceae bacterium]|nr:DUF188 domain-containing protein [Spirochaetaceae bacterium]
MDADSCPPQVRNHVVKYCSTRGISVYFVANKPVECAGADQNSFGMIVTDSTKDAADNYIFEHVTGGTLTNPSPDLVITRDIVFADRLVTKGVHVINDRGTEFTPDIIKERLGERDLNLQLANLGFTKTYHEGYDAKKFEKFCNCFDRVINRN